MTPLLLRRLAAVAGIVLGAAWTSACAAPASARDGATPADDARSPPADAPAGDLVTPPGDDASSPPGDAANDDAPSDDARTPPADATASDGDASAPPPAGPLWRQSAESGELASFVLDETTVASDGALEIRAGGGHDATDPYPAGGWHGGNYYNGGRYHFGAARSPDHVVPGGFTSVTPSFEAITPPGTWVNLKLAVRIRGTWTHDYVLGVWAYDSGTVRRHSVDGQRDATGDVQTDTLVLPERADALRITVALFSATAGVTPRVRAVAAVATDTTAPLPGDTADPGVWGTVLPVPQRSQMIYPMGGEVWCSPTSTTMLLAYWADRLARPELVQPVPTTADRTYDWVYDGNGNWPFNTAHGAGAAGGAALHGVVTRLAGFAQLERLVHAGIPVAISIAFAAGELHGAPISATSGHLIVVRGFASNGDVVCNDPAFRSDATVQVTYQRAELQRAWRHSDGTTYVLWPVGMRLPRDPLGAFY